jgi:fibronectin type 3 domain-containing protein
MPPPSHSVTLSWKASTASNVIGYNIYRATTSTGPYVQTNTALDPTTQDIDYNVLAGKTYYYVVAAVNSTGVESVYSNQVKALIPYP